MTLPPDPTSEPREGRSAALLLTDVVDSTKLSESLGDAAMAALWARHDRIARDLLPSHRGREIDKTDGLLLLFDDARDAVAYAVAYHAALRPLGIAARAGIHVGSVILTRNTAEDVARGAKPLEVDGIAKPVAARVMSVATGGQTLLTAEARAALGDTPLRTESHGWWRMKGVSQPIELFEIGDVDAPFAPPPDGAKVYRVVERDGVWVPVREVRHALPAERDAFVGRARDLDELARLLDTSRLVSVLGTGGTGKTRLVTRFAWTWLGDYPGGAWFCDLSEARGTDGIASAVARTLDVGLGADPIGQLGHVIAGRGPCLVVLDNFEQVAAHAQGTLGRWLDRAAEARFVVTTREVLGLPGETTLALGTLGPDESVNLFVARARAAHREFVLTDADRPAVEALAKLLDGLPLAIELAAARARVMPPKTLLQRMTDRFKLLASTGGRHARQATLRGALDWSWDLLSDDERSALAQLSVFEGGFTLDAAEAVLVLDGLWPMDAVQALVDKSLVRPVAHERFDLLVSVQDYASEKLDAAGGRAEAEARHADWFAEMGRAEALMALQFHGGTERRVALTRELDNVVAAARRGIARGDPEVAERAAAAAWAVFVNTGPFSPGMALLVAARPLVSDLRAIAHIELLLGWATFTTGGSLVQARAHIEASLDARRELGWGVHAAQAHLGVVAARQGRVDEAASWFEAALAGAREANDPLVQEHALLGLSSLHNRRGDDAAARAGYEAAIAIAREIGDRRNEGVMLGNLANVFMEGGRCDEAIACVDAALAIAREVGNRRSEITATSQLGSLAQRQGRNDAARQHFGTAIALAREIGDLSQQATSLVNLGTCHSADGNPVQAGACFEIAHGLVVELGDRTREGVTIGNLGNVHADLGRTDEARRCFESALALHRAVGFGYGTGHWLLGLARIEAAAGSDAWIRLVDEAVDASAPFRDVQLVARLERGDLRLGCGDVAGAREDVDACRALGGGALTEILEAKVRFREGHPDAAAALAVAERLAGEASPSSNVGRALAGARALVSSE